ncbi:MAG: hypothetical protein ACC661_05275 [Verrucomicrobiales bacterium]
MSQRAATHKDRQPTAHWGQFALPSPSSQQPKSKLLAIHNNPKREARELGDIAELPRGLPEPLSPEQLEKICRTHGPEGVYSGVL